jgi:alkylation response protein AidB-like acyl-CoA dehydrogenase
VAIGGHAEPRGGGIIGNAVEIWKQRRPDNPVQRDRLAALWIEAEVHRLSNLRAASARASQPGPEGSLGKIRDAELNKAVSAFIVDVLGAEGTLKPDGYPLVRPAHSALWLNPWQGFLRARGNSIEGGTTEISKNVVAERVLGLPGDVRTDRDVPWRDVPRG